MNDSLIRVEVWTDGSAKPHTSKAGGWAWVCIVTAGDRKFEFWKCGGASNTTNNRMELMAVVKALEFLWHSNLLGHPITIYSDSQYVVLGSNKWLQNWLSNDWNNGEVKNVDLWERISRLKNLVKPAIVWIKGHNGDCGNERVDKLAVSAAESTTLKRQRKEHVIRKGAV